MRPSSTFVHNTPIATADVTSDTKRTEAQSFDNQPFIPNPTFFADLGLHQKRQIVRIMT
jgi:hypothetical protein